MTELKEQIIELRWQSLGYKAIAKRLGSTKDKVRNICISNHLIGIRGTKCTPKSQEEWQRIFENKYAGFELIYNEKGSDGYNYILCGYCGNIFKLSAQNMRPSDIKVIGCPRCHELQHDAQRQEKIREQEERDKRIAEEKEIRFWNQTFTQTSMKECKRCGELFIPSSTQKKFCSPSCRKIFYGASKENKYQKKIPLKKLYNKYNGICHICGRRCDWNDYQINDDGIVIYGNDYPSRDHVIPKSKGGAHTWDNIRLAHRRCNSKKGNKLDFSL